MITFIFLALLSGIFLGVFITGLPNLASGKFGPPADHLDTIDRVYLSGVLLSQENELLLPRDALGAAVDFEISVGESTFDLTNRMESEGIISNAAAFRNFLHYSGLDTSIQAGLYKIGPNMTAMQIASELQDSTPDEVMFRILPGWRIEEIAAALPSSGMDISVEEFIEAARENPIDYGLEQFVPDSATAEGFMYPDSYRLKRTTSAQDLIATAIDNFQIKVDKKMLRGFERQGLVFADALILASIVEKEAVVESEAPIIASVFLNRLSAGMPLESDPTVQYALGYNPDQGTWWTNPLSSADLEIDSPYNTYIYNNLPPGPISNPSLVTLKAVAEPAQSDFYYFRAACDSSGTHTFAETYQEHLENTCP